MLHEMGRQAEQTTDAYCHLVSRGFLWTGSENTEMPVVSLAKEERDKW